MPGIIAATGGNGGRQFGSLSGQLHQVNSARVGRHSRICAIPLFAGSTGDAPELRVALRSKEVEPVLLGLGIVALSVSLIKSMLHQ